MCNEFLKKTKFCILFILISISLILEASSIDKTVKAQGAPPEKPGLPYVFNLWGVNWVVKDCGDRKVGPGGNYFIGQNVKIDWVNKTISLSIKYDKEKERWECAEIFSQQPFGYGEYCFEVGGMEPENRLYENVVLGFFSYDDDYHEIDVEISKWGKIDNLNSQFVVQPPEGAGEINSGSLLPISYGNKSRFDIPVAQIGKSSHVFTWLKDSAAFESKFGNNKKSWRTACRYIPRDRGKSRVQMNLYLFKGRPLTTNKNEKFSVVIKNFKFKAAGGK